MFANRPATGSLSRLMSAPESDSSLYPPKDKKTRRLWHELSTFKKSKEKGSKKNILQLPPANGYMRACAHHFSRLLGLTTETFTEGDTKAVRVRFDLGAADTGTKRKAPDGGFPGDGSEPDGNGPQSGDVAGHGQPSAAMGLTTDGAGTSQKVEESATSEVAAGAAKSGASDSAVQPTRRERAAFSSRLGKCAQTSDAVEATAIFEEMVKTGFTPSADMCATMIHLYSSAPSPMLSEALAVFECARATGGVPKEPVWSGMVKLHCARGDTTAGISYVQQMVAAGIAPRLRTFSPIIAAACNALDTDTARLAVQQAEGAPCCSAPCRIASRRR